jgi:hypothetical protein
MSCSAVICNEICKKSVYKVSESWIIRKRSFFFAKRKSRSEEVLFISLFSANRSFLGIPSLFFNLYTEGENWKIRSVYTIINKYLLYSNSEKWAWKEKEKTRKIYSSKEHFRLYKIDYSLSFFLSFHAWKISFSSHIFVKNTIFLHWEPHNSATVWARELKFGVAVGRSKRNNM